MLATRLPGILPPLQPEAALISAGILSLSGTFNPERFGERPFRAPHHSASPAAVIGGGCHFQQLMRPSGNKCDYTPSHFLTLS